MIDRRATGLAGRSDPVVHVVLVHPEIPQNTGSTARLCAATRTRLHLIRPLGFSLEDRYLKRAGLDYWPYVDLQVHENWEQFVTAATPGTPRFFSARAEKSYTEAPACEGPVFLVFGCETRGLPREILEANREDTYRIPIFVPEVRSLNLSNAVSIVVYDELRRRGQV